LTAYYDCIAAAFKLQAPAIGLCHADDTRYR
jgi:hypothetical protein